MNKSWTCHEQIMNMSWLKYDQVVNKTCTSHEQVMNKTWKKWTSGVLELYEMLKRLKILESFGLLEPIELKLPFKSTKVT